jgi:hypothetical protein
MHRVLPAGLPPKAKLLASSMLHTSSAINTPKRKNASSLEGLALSVILNPT